MGLLSITQTLLNSASDYTTTILKVQALSMSRSIASFITLSLLIQLISLQRASTFSLWHGVRVPRANKAHRLFTVWLSSVGERPHASDSQSSSARCAARRGDILSRGRQRLL